MTKPQQQKLMMIVLIAGAAGLAFWWWKRRSANGMAAQGTGVLATAAGPSSASVESTLGTKPVDDPEIKAARAMASGGTARSACRGLPYGERWINTTTSPYYGICVNQAMFDRWTQQSDRVQSYATARTVQLVLGVTQAGTV